MKIITHKLLIINLLIIISLFPSYIEAQSGCTDSQANNYNSAATINDGSCTYNPANISPTLSQNLSSTLNETSGLVFWNNQLWSHNDSSDSNIYSINSSTGAIIQSYAISATNTDWEDISQDDTHVYIGDFGNNGNGNRTDLKILKISKASILANAPIIETINFSYSNQVDFTPTGGNNTDFDCEAFIVSSNKIFLFTKQWVSHKTSVYSLDKTPGTQSAILETTFDIQGLVTGATYNETDRIIALCGYSSSLVPFSYLLYDFNNSNFFGANKRKIIINLPFHQVEGITHDTMNNFYITNENFVSAPFINNPQKLHKLNFSSFLDDYLNTATAQVHVNNGIADQGIKNSNVLIDGSTAFSTEAGAGPNEGKGIIIPSVDLVNFEFDLSFIDGATFPTYFDGMLVYNNATGTTRTDSTTGNRSSTATAVTPGFYYFFNPNGATNLNVTGGVWTAMGANNGSNGNNGSATPSVTVNCTGFRGVYCPNIALSGSGATYVVTITNNDFGAKQITPLTTDLTLSGGITVSAVSPSVATTVNEGESLVITYTLFGTPGEPGTLTGTFAKQGLTCSSTVTVGQSTVTAASSSPKTEEVGVAIAPITHTVTSAWGISNGNGVPGANGLPAGVSATWSGNTITISGTPTAGGTFNYSIPLIVGCGSAANATGTITVLRCGANVGGVFKEFACFNLGANTALNPHDPVVKGLHGNFYQWGRKDPVAHVDTPPGEIVGWNPVPADADEWLDASKTANDPCPPGFRVPTKEQFDALIDPSLNTISRTGSFIGHNYTSAVHFRPIGESQITLTLPAAGNRVNINGAVDNWDSKAQYWSSTIHTTTDWSYYHQTTIDSTVTSFNSRSYGMSVRCVHE